MTTKKEVTRERLLRTRPTFSQSLMVSVGISKLGHTDLVFIDLGVKINGAYYRDVLLSKQLLPVMREVSGESFVFQQDNAPAHWACDTVQLLEQRRRSFHRIFSQWTALTLIRLITGSGASSNSECTNAPECLTNWNSVCSKYGATSTRAMWLTSWCLRACMQENGRLFEHML